MTYTVKYKLPVQWFWRTIKRVKGDGILENGAARFFQLDDETRIEIPVQARFIFGKDRFLAIKKNMEKDAGQAIVTNGNS